MPKMNKLKSEKGFTMQDLIVAILMFTIFTGIICSTMYKVYELNARVSLSSQMAMYAVQILEDIDKKDYDLVENGMEDEYKTKFQIPNGFALQINVTNSSQTVGGQPTKKVELRIKYEFKGRDEELVITRQKVREA